MPRSRLLLLGVLVAVLVGGFLWRYGDTTAGVGPGTPTEQQVTLGWRQVDDVALDPVSRRLPGLAGAPDGVPARGTYLVNFWSSTCGPCRYEMPWLARLAREGHVHVLGVTRDNFARYALRAMHRAAVTYPNVRDEYGDFMATLRGVVPPQALPSTLVVVDGRVTWAHIGPFRSWKELHDSVTSRV